VQSAPGRADGRPLVVTGTATGTELAVVQRKLVLSLQIRRTASLPWALELLIRGLTT
jgi:hypothetical protein